MAIEPNDEVIESSEQDRIIKPTELDGETDATESNSRVVFAQQQFYGPLPPPEYLRGYESVLPGSAERILQLTEKQSAHRQSIEKHAIESEIRRSYAGTACGFIVAMSLIGVAWRALELGLPWAAGIIAAVDVTSVAAVFVIGTKARSQERLEKARIMSSLSVNTDDND